MTKKTKWQNMTKQGIHSVFLGSDFFPWCIKKEIQWNFITKIELGSNLVVKGQRNAPNPIAPSLANWIITNDLTHTNIHWMCWRDPGSIPGGQLSTALTLQPPADGKPHYSSRWEKRLMRLIIIITPLDRQGRPFHKKLKIQSQFKTLKHKMKTNH
jgi:hypothetical protein